MDEIKITDKQIIEHLKTCIQEISIDNKNLIRENRELKEQYKELYDTYYDAEGHELIGKESYKSLMIHSNNQKRQLKIFENRLKKIKDALKYLEEENG